MFQILLLSLYFFHPVVLVKLVPPKVSHIKTVIILGNSITRHTPDESLDWHNDWGMAATAKDSDYVHRLINDIHRKDKNVVVKFINIAEFEINFKTYNLHQLDALRNPDMLIMRIAENADDANADNNGFINYYGRLIKYLDFQNKAVKVVTDGFWKKSHVNAQIERYAKTNHLTYVNLDDLSGIPGSMATGQFKNPGVQLHPSNKGMRLIEERIWNTIKNYF